MPPKLTIIVWFMGACTTPYGFCYTPVILEEPLGGPDFFFAGYSISSMETPSNYVLIIVLGTINPFVKYIYNMYKIYI